MERGLSFSSPLSRQEAIDLDRQDRLAHFQERFLPADPGVIAYLDGNSLGRPLASIAAVWTDFVEHQWRGRLIRGWSEGWMDLPRAVGDELASAALGAAPGQTVIADSTTVNLYKVIRAALNLRPKRKRIILDRDNFPTNRYVVESLANDLGLQIDWLPELGASGVSVDNLVPLLNEDVAVVTLSHIAYHSGYLADVELITAAAHAVGALVVWDLCHSVGSTTIELDAWQVDFAVGCTYKFVGAGPGAPAFIYANQQHHERLNQPIWGWLGRRDAFEMQQNYESAAGIQAMISGTPAIPGILAVREGAAVIAAAGIENIRAKAISLGEYAIALADQWLLPLGFDIGSPRESDRRGAHVSVLRPNARQLCEQLIAAGVVPDFRTPDAIRMGLSPLTTRYVEVFDGLDVLRTLAG